METFIPNERRKVRAYRESGAMLRKGNRKALDMPLNPVVSSNDHCSICGQPWEPGIYWKGSDWVRGRTQSTVRPDRCVKHERRRSGVVAAVTPLPMRVLTVHDYADRLRRLQPKEVGAFWSTVPKRLRRKVDRMTDLAYLREVATRAECGVYSSAVQANTFVFGDYGAKVTVLFDAQGFLVKAQTVDLRMGHRGRTTLNGRNRAAQAADFIKTIGG